MLSHSLAQEFTITGIQIGLDHRPSIHYGASSNRYYILLRGNSLTNITQPVHAELFSITNATLTDPNLVGQSQTVFYKVRGIPRETPLDLDGDGLDDVYELLRPLYLDPLNPNDGPQAPPAPVISYPTNATTSSFVIFSGRGPTNTLIRVEGGAAFVTNVVDGTGFFEVTVPLNPNRLNRLFVSAINEFGQSSPPAPVDILQDSTAPYLFIDFPTNGTTVTASNTLVAGRVGDALSGFLGLSVTVNGQAANVDVGIGPNGTFQRGEVPLHLGTNELAVTAADRLGNSVTKQVTVIRQEPVGPRLAATSGDLQETNIQRRLPLPLVVNVAQPDGAPIANQLLTFQVTRSDGRLRPVNTNQLAVDFTQRPDYSSNGAMLVQLLTDASGEARVWWTMGMDAGHANNRVTVTGAGLADTVFFCASATALPANQINIGSGNNQRGETFGPAPEPLKVWVSDGNNPAAGIPVTFRVTQGGGTLLPIISSDGASPAGPGLRAASRASGSFTLAAAGTPPATGSEEVTVFTSMTGHAEADFTFGPAAGNQVIEATFPGYAGLPATFTLNALARVPGKPTTFIGSIQDNAVQPIGHAHVELEVAGAHYQTFSDLEGRFAFSDIASGAGHLKVDGITATSLGTNAIPTNSFPALQYTVLVVPNAENSLPTPVLLPRLNTNNTRWYYGTNDIVLTCEGMAGLKMTIKANSMKHPGGEIVSPGRPALLSLNQVHHDDIPMPMPDGAAPPFAWTLQPGGATFDPPVQVEYPNMSGLAPGAAAFFLTFNHDTERFEIVASGHVVQDGSKIVCDPGAGLTISGWGCNCPPYAVTGECKKCEAAPGAFQPAADDYKFIEPTIRPKDEPRDSTLCGHVDIGTPKDPPAYCGCDPSNGNKNTKLRIEITIFIKDKWYNSIITNPTDIASVDTHENEHIAIAKAFFEKMKLEAVKVNNNTYGREEACDFNAEVFNKMFAKELANMRSHLKDPDTEAAERSCTLLLRKYRNSSPSPFAPASEPGPTEEFVESDISEFWNLSVNGQTLTTTRLNSFRIKNISAADLFGPGGPGTAPDFLSDDFIRLTGYSDSFVPRRYVFSEPFQIRRGDPAQITGLTFTDTPPPVPESIRIVPDSPVLTVTGQVTQVRVTATLHGGATMDITPRTLWTTYRTSNPQVATVDGDGLVTARAKGMVFITAVNDAATSVCQIDVVPGDPLTVVRGTVRDTNGAPVAGVNVSVSGLATPPVTTEADGSFVLTNVPTSFGPLRVLARVIGAGSASFATILLDPVAGGITDAGNLTLRQGVAWIAAGSGVWHGPTNWSGGVVPGPGSDVYIAATPGTVVTISQGSNVVNNLVLFTPLRLTGGSLRVVNPIQASSPLQLSGGTLSHSVVESTGLGVLGTNGTLDSITLNCDMDALSGTLTVLNGLTVNRVLRVGHPTGGNLGTLNLQGSQALSGTGSIVFGNSSCNAVRLTTGGTTLTNRLLIRGHSGHVPYSACAGGAANVALVNEATVAADVTGGTITVRGQPTRNFGSLLAGPGTLSVVGLLGDLNTAAVSGGHLALDGTYTNNLALPVNAGTLTLNGDWFNGGQLLLTNSVLNLGGTFGLGDLGNITRVGGSVRVTGVLNGAGGIFELNPSTGNWLMNGGTLRQLTLNSTGGAVLQASDAGGTLDGVTLNCNLDVLDGTLSVTNGLVVNGLLRVGNPANGAAGTVNFVGSQAIGGGGSVVFGNSSCNALRLTTGGTTLTNRLLIRGQSGQVPYSACVGGAANVALVNEATIAADIAGGTITVRGQPVRNSGSLVASPGTLSVIGLLGDLNTASIAGGHLALDGTYTNNLGLPVNGGTLTLNGDWFNGGQLLLTNSVLNLGGTFSLGDLGSITRVGGSVRVTGLLNGAGETLVLNAATGIWSMNGGTLRQLTVNSTDGVVLLATSSGGTLDGVTLNCDLDVQSGNLNLTNGLVVNGLMRVGNPTNGVGGQVGLLGSQAISGSGAIVFGNSSCNTLRLVSANTTLTNRLLIRGHSGQLPYSTCVGGPANVALINEGTLSADILGGTITVRGQPVRNFGSLIASPGTLRLIGLLGDLGVASVAAGHLDVDGAYTNNLGLPVNGGTLTLNGDWFNGGQLLLTNSVLNLDGVFGLGDLGNITRIGSAVRVTGLFDGAGGTFQLNAATGNWSVNGGTLRQLTLNSADGAFLLTTSSGGVLDGVTLNCDLDVQSGIINVTNGLVVNQLMRVGNPTNSFAGQVGLLGSQAITGSGSIVFGNSSCNSLRLILGNTTLTNRLLIHGHTGLLPFSSCTGGAANVAFVNEAVIAADVAGGTLTVRAQPVRNAGQLVAGPGTLSLIGLVGDVNAASVAAGGHLSLDGTYTNNLALPVNGGTLTLNGDWFNGGQLSLSNSTLNLGGSYGLGDLGTINRIGGAVRVTGLFDGAGGTFQLNAATGNWSVNGGTLRQLTLNSADGAFLLTTSSGGVLDGVTLNCDLDVQSGIINVTNGLVVNQLMRVGNPTNSFAGQVGLLGSQAITGSGSIVFGNSSCNSLRLLQGNTTLTNRLLIRGHTGLLPYSSCAGGAANVALVNEATIAADIPGGTLTVRGQSVYNFGSLLASPGVLSVIGLIGDLNAASVSGGHLALDGTYTNNLALPVSVGTLTLNGDWFNGGQLLLTNSVLNLGGTFGLADLGSITRIGGSVRVTGLLNGAGGTLLLDASTGNWSINGGTLRQLTVNSANGALLFASTSAGVLDNVTLNSDLDVQAGSLSVTNGLVVNGVARVGHPTTAANGALNFLGSQALGGSGSVLFGNGSCNTLRLLLGNTTLTNRILIHGHTGLLPYSACAGGLLNVGLVNEATISADVNLGTITLRAQPFINLGTTNALNGGRLVLIP